MGIISSVLISFFGLFLAIDALGKIPNFNLIIQGGPEKEQNKALKNWIQYVLGISLGIIFLGVILFWIMGVSLADFKIAGGILLFILIVRALMGNPEVKKTQDKFFAEILLFVLNPRVIIMLLILADAFGIIIAFITYALNILFCFYIFKHQNYFMKKIDMAGINLCSKITNIILAGFAVTLIREGILLIIR
ncbi:MAG: MarC family protein [Candidatus Omnitrophota bacterium]